MQCTSPTKSRLNPVRIKTLMRARVDNRLKVGNDDQAIKQGTQFVLKIVDKTVTCGGTPVARHKTSTDRKRRGAALHLRTNGGLAADGT
jgi:hypothetical protein